jgi:hypothetical protein
MSHIEIHWCETATDAARLEYAGLPRLDLEPTECTACHARVGEVTGTNGDVFWKPCGLVLNGDAIGVLCRGCFRPVDKALQAR